MTNYFKIFFSIVLIIFLIIYSYFFLYSSKLSSENIENSIDNDNYYFTNNDFFWPLPGFHKITSPFGPRKAPRPGSSSNHSGIDIAAPQGTSIYAVLSGTVSFVGFKGAGGCTITIHSDQYDISYCHVSPDYIVSNGMYVKSGTHISDVGPKNLYGIPGNPYTDSNGNPTNGSTTGCHLHLTIRENGIPINPLLFF